MADDNGTGTTPSTDDSGKTPKFEGEFDAARAARLIENLRADIDKIKSERDGLKETVTKREDAEKTEIERLTARAETAEKALKDANRETAREKVARKHEIPDDLLPFLTGDSPEEMEKAAEALAKYAGKVKADEEEINPLDGKPKTRLVPGHTTDEKATEGFDPEKVAATIRQNGGF